MFKYLIAVCVAFFCLTGCAAYPDQADDYGRAAKQGVKESFPNPATVLRGTMRDIGRSAGR